MPVYLCVEILEERLTDFSFDLVESFLLANNEVLADCGLYENNIYLTSMSNPHNLSNKQFMFYCSH